MYLTEQLFTHLKKKAAEGSLDFLLQVSYPIINQCNVKLNHKHCLAQTVLIRHRFQWCF